MHENGRMGGRELPGNDFRPYPLVILTAYGYTDTDTRSHVGTDAAVKLRG